MKHLMNLKRRRWFSKTEVLMLTGAATITTKARKYAHDALPSQVLPLVGRLDKATTEFVDKLGRRGRSRQSGEKGIRLK